MSRSAQPWPMRPVGRRGPSTGRSTPPWEPGARGGRPPPARGLDAVHTAGAALGMDSGIDDLVGLAAGNPAFAPYAVAAGGVRPEHVPWLVRAGITRLHLGAAVRPGGSWTKAHADAGFVRSWRM